MQWKSSAFAASGPTELTSIWPSRSPLTVFGSRGPTLNASPKCGVPCQRADRCGAMFRRLVCDSFPQALWFAKRLYAGNATTSMGRQPRIAYFSSLTDRNPYLVTCLRRANWQSANRRRNKRPTLWTAPHRVESLSLVKGSPARRPPQIDFGPSSFMQHQATQPPSEMTLIGLNYAPRAWRSGHSFYSILSLAMAFVVIAWLYFVEFERPRSHQGGPLWEALWENASWPGGIGIGCAVLGLLQTGRKRSLSIVAIVIIVIAYIILSPAANFA